MPRRAGTTQQADFYADPSVYDILHAPGTGDEVDALERIAKRIFGSARHLHWIEPACGTGRYLRELARRGHTAAGFDLSEPMVRYAKSAAKKAGVGESLDLFVADMQTFDRARLLAPVDVAFNLINTIRHLNTDRDMLAHMRAIARVLKPGGVYVVGLSMCAYGFEQETEDVWTGKRAGTSVTQVVQYLPPKGSVGKARAERVVSHLTIVEGQRTRHVDSAYTLRGYDLAQWREIISAASFRVLGVVDSDGRPMTPRDIGYEVWILTPA
ncbi:MAG: class I SAM-dependent methyltransferase [Planctomycetes bacterium]|nr:class I SAM-dependent methyltransferase [Planctomycetota bacterium]